ncbi:MAG: ArnT family glycosyltransferase, partial [Ktedonobacterales bacterium]
MAFRFSRASLRGVRKRTPDRDTDSTGYSGIAEPAQGGERSSRGMNATREREQVNRTPSAITRLAVPARLRALPSRWLWLRYWEFWFALALGAFLRLWQLGTSQFLDDQAILMSMARSSVVQHAIPITGIPSSIHALNPPLSVYLLMPFALFGKDPFPAIVALALWNVAGVALCYIFAWRYFGRRVAAIGTLLFATSGAAVDFSRFLWQQNYMPPLLILWALATFAGALRGTRGWFFASATLLALATLLHPTALLLAPVLLAAFALAPRKPHIE